LLLYVTGRVGLLMITLLVAAVLLGIPSRPALFAALALFVIWKRHQTRSSSVTRKPGRVPGECGFTASPRP
jgi:hypothetical protein